MESPIVTDKHVWLKIYNTVMAEILRHGKLSVMEAAFRAQTAAHEAVKHFRNETF